MAWPPDVADGDIIMAAHINAIRDSARNWQGAIEANKNILNRVGQIVVADIGTVPADENYWKLFANNGQLYLTVTNDADSAAANVFEVDRTGATAASILFRAANVTLKGTGGSIGYPGAVADWAGWCFNQEDAAGKSGFVCGNRRREASSYEFVVGSIFNAGAGFQIDFAINGVGDIYTPALRTTNPGAGSKKWWADPADGYRIKFAA